MVPAPIFIGAERNEHDPTYSVLPPVWAADKQLDSRVRRLQAEARGLQMKAMDRLEQLITGKVCLRCDSEPRIIWGGSFGVKDYLLRCNCPLVEGRPQEPKLGRPERPIERRYREMTNQQIQRLGEDAIRYQWGKQEIALSVRIIREYFCPLASESEALRFIYFCAAQGLNPHSREVYLIKYDPKVTAQIVVGRDAYLRRVEQHPQFDGFSDGLVIERAGELERIKGALLPPGATLIGAWCSVKRKDRSVELYKEISFVEFDRGQSTWKKMPAYMINKCAITRALNDAFPGILSSDALVEGMDVEIERPKSATHEAIDAPPIVEASSQQALAEDFVPALEPHPWLLTCPLDNQPWAKQQAASGGEFYSHPLDAGTWCNRDGTLKLLLIAEVEKAQAALGWDAQTTRAWFNETYGLPLANLAWPDRLAAMEGLKKHAAQSQPPKEALNE